MLFSSIKGINRLISKGMSNIYLKVTIKKNWRSQNFEFLSLNICLQFSFWRAPTQAGIIEFWNFLLQLKNQTTGRKLCVAFLIF